MIDLCREIRKPGLKLDFMAHGMAKWSEHEIDKGIFSFNPTHHGPKLRIHHYHCDNFPRKTSQLRISKKATYFQKRVAN